MTPSRDEAEDREVRGTDPTFEARGLDAVTRALSLRVIESTHDFVAVVDRDLHYVLWNPAAERMTGIARDAILGRAMEEIVPMPSRSRAIERARAALAGETVDQRDPERIAAPDGETRWVVGRWSPVRDETGTIVAALAVRQDVTEREEARQNEVRNARLLGLGRLVGGVAHEVRNPLFGISASLDALELELGGERKHQPLLAGIRLEVNALRTLVDELLAYGRPSMPVLGVVPLRAPIDEALRATTLTAASRDVRVVLAFEIDGDPRVRGDVQRLPRLFGNVIDNAIRFSPKGGQVDVRVVAVAGDRVEIHVGDRGPGFPAESLADVFEPFFSTRSGGTGLGLAIAAQIAAEHGGRIAASTREGGGGLVVIGLPRVSEST